MFTLNKHDILSFEHLLPSDALSTAEPTVAQLIDKRIQRLTRQCFDIQSYNDQIEQWFIEKDKQSKTQDDTKDNADENDKKIQPKQEESPPQDVTEEDTQTATKTDTVEEDKDTDTKEDEKGKTDENPTEKKKSIATRYPDLEKIGDPYTKYALIMFHAMISSLDLTQHIGFLCGDKSTEMNHNSDYGVISKYIQNLHSIFSLMTTHEIRSGLKGSNDPSDKSVDLGVLSHIKQFVIECIATKTRNKSTSNHNQLIWQRLFEILIKLSIGNTNVSSLLQCIWYLLALIETENGIKFNLKSTIKYIANLRMLNIAENNKKYIHSTVYGFGKSTEGRIGCKLHLSEQIISEPRNIDTLNGAMQPKYILSDYLRFIHHQLPPV